LFFNIKRLAALYAFVSDRGLFEPAFLVGAYHRQPAPALVAVVSQEGDFAAFGADNFERQSA
jgi:hypothetical protein